MGDDKDGGVECTERGATSPRRRNANNSPSQVKSGKFIIYHRKISK